MKKHMLLISNLIMIFAVMAGFAVSVYQDTTSYQQVVEKHLQDVVSLADTDISNCIDSSMSKPVMVSKTMANDEFLKTWLSAEPKNTGDEAYLKQLYGYLKAYRKKYNYTTVFCVSAQTGNYYYQDGLNKTVSKNDPHDVWYYNFVASGHEYDLEVDTDQASHNDVAVFVNFRVTGDDGRLLGVIGVALQASFIRDTVRSYEKDYNLSVYIVNEGGSPNSFKGNTDIFVSRNSLPAYTGVRDQIVLDPSGKSQVQWFTSGGERKCLITKYDPALAWYLVLEMKTSSIISAFQKRMLSNVLFMLLSLAACILVTTAVFFNYNRRIVEVENTDDLTGLPNRKLFSKQYQAFLRKQRGKTATFFMLDIDRFKEINDTHGHIYGNAVLVMVAKELKKAVGPSGIAARWGGDEFIGLLPVGPEEARNIFNSFSEALRNGEEGDVCRVTVSVGLAVLDENLDVEQAVQRADDGMYSSKENGRDRITLR